MIAHKPQNQTVNYLLVTSLVLSILLTGANLYLLYRKGAEAKKKKCPCQEGK